MNAVVNNIANAHTLIDQGCLTWGAVSTKFARRKKLKRTSIHPIQMRGINSAFTVDTIAWINIDIDGHQEKLAVYVSPDTLGYDLILGRSWLLHNRVTIQDWRDRLHIDTSGTTVLNTSRNHPDNNNTNIREISAAAFMTHMRRAEGAKKTTAVTTQHADTCTTNSHDTPLPSSPLSGHQFFAVSIADINKALKPKKRSDPKDKLPDWATQFTPLFDPKEAEKLPPHRGPDVDVGIDFTQVNGKDPEPPWGPLYNMS